MTHRVYIDTNIFIAAFEAFDALSHDVWTLFESFSRGDLIGVTSELTLAELLSKPIKNNQTDLIDVYKNFFATGKAPIEVIAVSRDVLIDAAALRAIDPKTKLPDAIHVATAARRGCAVIVSGDRRLPVPADMQVVRMSPHWLRDIERLTA